MGKKMQDTKGDINPEDSPEEIDAKEERKKHAKLEKELNNKILSRRHDKSDTKVCEIIDSYPNIALEVTEGGLYEPAHGLAQGDIQAQVTI